MQELRQSLQYAEYMKEIGWTVESADSCQIFIKKFPIFSFIKIQRPEEIPFSKIDKIAKKKRAFVVCLEPSTVNHQSSIINHGYRPAKSPYLPSKTIHLNLTLSEEKILAQMKKDARYSIRKAREIEIKKLKYEDIGGFHHAWKKSINWRRYRPSLKTLQALKQAFGQNAIFLRATLRHMPSAKMLAGAVILTAGKTAYYYYAFTSNEGRRKFAQYLLVWEAIKLAKKQGCKIFDFEGIYDPRFPQKSWRGFSHFKKSFGGKEIEYPESFRKYRLPF